MKEASIQHRVIIYAIAINVVTFIAFGIDKWKAKHSRWRIPEAVLLGLAVVGGSIGALLGMEVWRHKTMHKKFKYGVPLILLAQIAMIALTSCGTKKEVATTMPIQHGSSIREHSPNVFLIQYDAEVGKDPLLKAIKEYKCEIVYDYHTITGMALKKPDDNTLEETMQHFRTVKGVTTVEYDYLLRLTDPVKPKLEIK